MKMHNAVVRPHIGGVNPYHLGFYIFQKLEKEYGLENEELDNKNLEAARG